jgi:glycosyltransferase involved in cell wall biosynthesis
MHIKSLETCADDSLVSVIVPTYNRAYCICAAIDSVLAQTHANWEMIIIDDGSTDNTKDLVLSKYGHDERIRYFYQRNFGVSVARNSGLRQARGEFIAFLDSDDLWEPWKLEIEVLVLNRLPEAGMVWTDMKAVDKEGKMITANYLRRMYDAYKSFPTAESLFGSSLRLSAIAPHLNELAPGKHVYFGDIFSQMLLGSLVHTSTVLLRRTRCKRVGLFREDYLAGEDYDYHLRTCREGAVAFIDVSSITYQVGRSDQLTVRCRTHIALNYLNTVEPMLSQDRGRVSLPPDMLNGAFAEAYADVGDLLMENGDVSKALKALWTSLSYRVGQPRTLALFILCLLPFSLGRRLRRAYRSAKSAIGAPRPHNPRFDRVL